MLKISICDDDLQSLKETEEYINSWCREKHIPAAVTTFDNGDALLSHFHADSPDIIFLDIMMPLFSGMDAAREIRRHNSAVKIIFLTSSPEFAVESYDVKASGYLLKPVVVQKMYDLLNDCIMTINKEPEHMIIRTMGGYQKIYLHTIECIEAQGRKVLFHLTSGESEESLSTFSGYAESLTVEQGFYKCHRSYIVYMPNIDHFNSAEIVTISGICVPVARGYSKSFKEAYFNHMFKKER